MKVTVYRLGVRPELVSPHPASWPASCVAPLAAKSQPFLAASETRKIPHVVDLTLVVLHVPERERPTHSHLERCWLRWDGIPEPGKEPTSTWTFAAATAAEELSSAVIGSVEETVAAGQRAPAEPETTLLPATFSLRSRLPLPRRLETSRSSTRSRNHRDRSRETCL